MLFNTVLWWCINLYYNLVYYYIPEVRLKENSDITAIQRSDNEKFEVVYQWNYLNYTWESTKQYTQAIYSGIYIPENNAPTGLKIYQNKMFLTVPRFRPGIPATLVYLDMNAGLNYKNPLLTPYPDWKSNDDTASCTNLQSVQSMEVDTSGVMWIIDGVRINNYTRCPAKLILLDLNNGGKRIHSYVFLETLVRRNGGFLNDIVVDETDGDFAYITENSQDPGIIVYSKRKNQAWKLRHISMHFEPNAVQFKVEDIVFDLPVPVDGIALSPVRSNGEKTLFYCSLSSLSLYSIPTHIIKNKELTKFGRWKHDVKLVGKKTAQSDGIAIDENGNMFLTMLPYYGVAAWNIDLPFSTISLIDVNRETMVWPDGFGFDQQGFLYVISNTIFRYIDLRRKPMITNDTPFRVLRIFTGTRSYLYG